MTPQNEATNVIRIRPYPKIIFYYPTVILAGVYSLLFLFGFSAESNPWPNLVFVIIFALNTLVFAFDFSVQMTIIIGVVVLLGSTIIALLNWFSAIGGWFLVFNPMMNDHFYYFYFLFFIIVFILVYIRTRFNYFDIRHNELFHKHGFLSDTQRINAPHLSYKREIVDVFEYFLLRAGRIKIMSRDREPFILETVIGIKKIDKKLGEILSKMKVTFDDGSLSSNQD